MHSYLPYSSSFIGISLARMAGQWLITMPNEFTFTIFVTSGGLVAVTSDDSNINGRTAMVATSDNAFPPSQGWYKITNLIKDSTWDYFRFKADGSLEVRHFSSDTDDGCSGDHNGASNYCSEGTGSIQSTLYSYIKVINKLRWGTF